MEVHPILHKMKMSKLYILFVIFLLSAHAKSNLSDDQIKQVIIQDSISQYSGHCPCPYNVASNGSQCGRRSAYSKPGGYSPICYPADVTEEMIRRYRQRN